MKPEEFDFLSANTSDLPEGYPVNFTFDQYSREPFLPDYEARREAYLAFCASNPARPLVKGYLYELARMEVRKDPVNFGAVYGAMRYVDQRIDCSDFVLLGIIRLVIQFGKSGMIPEDVLKKAKETILRFKYWPDEPGHDSMCTWTENHQVLFATCEYLAGMMYPEEIFSNSGDLGRRKMDKARNRLIRWMELRFRTGFNEWLSNVYYDEDIAALATLFDFCDDTALVRGAECMLDLLFYDMALNSFKGTFGCTHGRSYERQKKSGANESTADTQKLAFGKGIFGEEDNMSGIHLALSGYRLPKVIYDIAADSDRDEFVNNHIAGIKIKEAPRWGLSFDDLDDGMTLLSFEAYTHPKTFGLFLKMLDAYDWGVNDFFVEFRKIRKALKFIDKVGLLGAVGWLLRKDVSRNTREEVHTITYRTPDYMLSAALDYKKGYGGDQQHIWQATLSEEAICFTTHPGGFTHRSPDYWTGSGFLPRAAMCKNVLIAIYNISSMPGFYVRKIHDFTHAYFPKDRFDEIVEKNGWLFGRKDKGYIALYSRNGYRWQTAGKDQNAEIIAKGKENIWLCEMGREATHGEFEAFVDSISKAHLNFSRLYVSYDSPSQGRVEFGWNRPFCIDTKEMPLRHRFRYDNPYSQVEFDPKIIEVKKGDEWLSLELDGYKRSLSSTI